MKLVVNESIFYDYNTGKENTIQTVIREDRGHGAIPRLIECFRCNLLQCVRLVVEDGENMQNIIDSTRMYFKYHKITDSYMTVDKGKIFLVKSGKGVAGGRKENVYPKSNGK